MARRPARLTDLAPAAIAPVAALVAYLPTLVVPYAFMDDYMLLAWRRGIDVGNFFTTAAQFGRPLHGVVLWGTFSLANDIDSLRLVRAVSLLGVILLALVLYYALRRAEWNRWLAAGMCTSVVTLASIQVYVSWAATGEVPYVAALAGLAWLRLRTAFALPRRDALLRSAEAAALLLLALLTYQPAAMFFWVFAAIDALRPGEQLRAATRKVGWGLGVAAVAMFFSYAAVRIGVHFWGGAFAARTNLVDDIVAKVRWFWNEPIVNGLGMYGLVPSESLALAIAVVATVGIALLHRRNALGFLGLAVLLVPLAYTPNLVISENFATYRSIGALAALLSLYVWLGLWGIGRALRGRVNAAVLVATAAVLGFAALALLVRPLWKPATPVTLDTLTHWPELAVFVLLFLVIAAVAIWARRAPASRLRVALAGGVLAFAGVAAVVAARNVTTLVIKPQSVELQLLRSRLSSPTQPAGILFVKPTPAQSAAPLVRYDEFGPPSTYFPWVPNPAVQLVLRERRERTPKLEIFASDEAPASAPAGDALVDMRALEQRRVDWSVWTLHATGPNAPSAQPR